MIPSGKPQNMMQALGYDAVAWMWAIRQPTCARGEDLLMAINDGDYRTLREMFEEPDTHDMLGKNEIMFSAFIMTCAMQADRRCWEELSSHGYGLETQFIEPIFDETGQFLCMADTPTRLGHWIGAFCSLERVLDLSDDMGWEIFNIDGGDARHKIGCEWRLSGIHADEGWADVWKRQYKQVMDARRQRELNRPTGVSETKRAPVVLFIMDEWASKSEAKGEGQAAERGWRRLDGMIMTWARECYWPARDHNLWDRFMEQPPYINPTQIDTQKAARTMVRALGLLAGAARESLPDLLARVENLGWMIDQGWHIHAAALIKLGVPLEQNGVDVGEVILRRALLSKGSSVDSTLWDAWMERVQAQGNQAWERLPEFVRKMSPGSIRMRVQKDAPFKEMLEMALQTQTKPAAKPIARF